jgi:uncharacterized membrane protein
MHEEAAITAVGRAIQFSVAPVFLLSAIGGMLSVMIARIGRVVDRAREVESRMVEALPDGRGLLQKELARLVLRMHLIQRAITFCVLTAIFVCLVVVTLFVGAFYEYQFVFAVAGFFVAAMLMFLVGLLYFLREIFIATGSIPIGLR